MEMKNKYLSTVGMNPVHNLFIMLVCFSSCICGKADEKHMFV